jgi:chemotaxis protein MotB
LYQSNQSSDDINFWPALIDLITSVFIVFILTSFLHDLLNVKNLEAMRTQSRQQKFLGVFREEFRSEIASGHVGVFSNLDFLQITFGDGVLFDNKEHQLQEQGRAVLQRCARVIREAGGSDFKQIQVEGHTDNRPLKQNKYPSNNWELSTARAVSVVQFLSSEGRLPSGVFSASGYESYRPVASNDSPAGRASNRRIELRIFFAGQRRQAQPPRAAAEPARVAP